MAETFDLNFLAPELGGRADPESEGLGVVFRELKFDREMRQLAWQLWQDYQRSVKVRPKSLADSGLTPADLLQPGVTETLETCSTEEELRRYRLKLTLRADILEALLEETLSELDRANRATPVNRPTEPD